MTRLRSLVLFVLVLAAMLFAQVAQAGVFRGRGCGGCNGHAFGYRLFHPFAHRGCGSCNQCPSTNNFPRPMAPEPKLQAMPKKTSTSTCTDPDCNK